MKMKQYLLGAFILAASATSSFADEPSVHGMLLFGKTSTYASHLPMYHPPHDYQAIFQLNLKADDRDPGGLAKYEEAKKTNTLFTLVPELMDLTKVMDGTKTSFKADIFQGHFERGGQLIANVVVEVSKVLIHEKLIEASPPSKDFLVFGQNGEYFAAHIIKGNQQVPTYDAVMESSQPYRVHSSRTGDYKVLVSDSKLPIVVRGENSLAQTPPQDGDSIGGIFNTFFGMKVKKMIYVEVDELNTPM